MDNEKAEEFFGKLLGFGPDWGVETIELLEDGSTVELKLEHRREKQTEGQAFWREETAGQGLF